MPRQRTWAGRRLCGFLLAAATSLLAAVPAPARAPGELAEERVEKRVGDGVKITFLQTTDLHCHLLPWDYVRASEDDVGLARVATRIRAIRRTVGNVILLDAGDTIQGSPIAYLHARKPNTDVDPMAAAMSELKYDAMAVGNHEYNFGLAVLRKAQRECSFPWLSANTRNLDGSAAFGEYLVKDVGGVRVGILGLTTPNIPSWEPEANRPGLVFEDPVATAKRLVPLLRGRERCDLVAVLIHSGLEVDVKTGQPDGTDAENRVAALTREVPGIDLVFAGHTHRRIPLTRVNGVSVIQPGRFGDTLARVDVALTRAGDRWAVSSIGGELLPSSRDVAPDAAIARIAEPYHRAAEAYLAEAIGTADEALPADRARIEDTALLDFVNDTQLEATGADLSMTSLLPGGRFPGIPKGPITVRNLYALYPYENQLEIVEIDGAQLKACLERAAEYYASASWEGGRLVLRPNDRMVPYNFDVVQGASYRIDPTAAPGARIKELTVKGRPVKPNDRFTLAVNAYRAQGSGGYTALKGSRVVKAISDQVRELLIERVRRLGRIVPRVDHNWIVAADDVWAPDAFSSRRP